MNLTHALTELEGTALVRRLSEAELAYLFKHALVQDTAYESLLKTERKRLHRLIGAALECAYPDALDENAARLAGHYAEAGDDAKTFEYARRAGDVAARVYANAEAINFYQLAFQAGSHARLDATRWIELYSKLGRAYEVSNAFDRALELYERMEEQAVAGHDEALRLAALMNRATLYATPTPLFDPARGEADLNTALALARHRNDGAAQAKILWNLLLLYGFSRRGAQALEYGKQSLQLARELGLTEQLAYTLNDIGSFGYSAVGAVDETFAALAQARGLWEQLGNLPMLTDNLNNTGIFYQLVGEYARALESTRRALEISETINNLWNQSLACGVQCAVYFELGEWDKALAMGQRAVAIGRAQRFGVLLINATVYALLLASLGAPEAGYPVMREATDLFDIPLYRAPSHSALALLAFQTGRQEEANAIVHDAQGIEYRDALFMALPVILAKGELALAAGEYATLLDWMRELGVAFASQHILGYVADALYYEARALIGLDRRAEAQNVLERARALAERIQSRRALWRILGTTAALERECGNRERAQVVAKEGRAVIEYLVSRTPSEYRAAFLNQNEVRQLMTLAP